MRKSINFNYDTWESTTHHRKLRQYVAYINHGGDYNSRATSWPQYTRVWKHRGGSFASGARVYSISMVEASQQYGVMSKSLDTYCYKHQDFVVLVAAGNIGSRDKASGGAVPHTVGSPASAKSAVAVGSHHNIRDLQTEGPNTMTFLAKTSSRGPTLDGRIKPDICAPGKQVVSANIGPRPGAKTCATQSFSGTSMATPIAAGLTVLVRQYFMDGFYPMGVKQASNSLVPMGALLKAILVNCGRPLSVPNKLKKSPSSPSRELLPNNDQGWGGLDISTTLVTPTSPRRLALKVYGKWSKNCQDCPVVYHGETLEYKIQITKTNPHQLPLKVTLVWFDKPASSSATTFIINNLDLRITEEDEESDPFLFDPAKEEDGSSGPIPFSSSTHHPNGRDTPDPINTVEHISIRSPKAGRYYTVGVNGANVPLQYQYFALVISGPFESNGVKETLINPHKERQ